MGKDKNLKVVNTFKTYFRLVSVSLQSQMEYRLSFFMMFISHFIVTGFEFLGVFALFGRFGSLKGWVLAEVCLLYGFISMAFAFVEIFTRRIQKLSDYIRSGELDRVLLRPQGNLLQLSGMEINLSRLGRFLQGFLVFCWGMVQLQLDVTLWRMALLLWTFSGAAVLFTGLMIVQGALSFWTVQSLEIMNTLTYGGGEVAQYPMPIYKEWFRGFFTFIVPLACVNYFPMLLFMGKPDPLGSPVWFQAAAPAMGILFFGASLLFWRLGIRKYSSTGS